MSSKGQETRSRIVQTALERATVVGIEGLTLGDLASALELSKSGLFAHFRSKEALQIAVLEAAVERFEQRVVLPAVRAPRGEPRLRALFERWLEWGRSEPGGCIFVTAAAELDDRPGPVRDLLVQIMRDLQATLARAVRLTVEEGHFRRDVDPDQFAFEMHAITLAYHHRSRLLNEPRAVARANVALERLLAASRPARA